MQHQAIERLLPAAYQRSSSPGTVLAALLDVMESMHAPDEAVLESVDDLFTAYRTMDPLVAYLVRWLALDHLLPRPRADGAQSRLPIPVNRLRDLVAEGATLAQWRGTPDGLRRMLEIATGTVGFTIEEPADRRRRETGGHNRGDTGSDASSRGLRNTDDHIQGNESWHTRGFRHQR